MAEIMCTSQAVPRRAEPLSWLQRVFLALGRPLQRDRRAWRIDEQVWSGYMLRDIGLAEGRSTRDRGPRDIPIDWPLR